MRNRICLLVSTMMIAVNTWATEVSVSDAWARATAPGQDNGSIQFSITSQQEAKLVEASSPVAGKVELHSMSHENGMMEMRPVVSIALPAGKTVDLAASGKHIMLIGLKQSLKAGDSIPFTLIVQYADKSKAVVKASAEVRSITYSHETHPGPDMNSMPGM